MKIIMAQTRPDYEAAMAKAREKHRHVIDLPIFPFDVGNDRPWRDWVIDELDHPDAVIILTSAQGFLRDGPHDWPQAMAVVTDSDAVAVMIALRAD